MNYKEFVIKRPLWADILLFLICASFIAGGLLLFNSDRGLKSTLIGITLMVSCSGLYLFYLIFLINKPIATISSKGVTIPYLAYENFLPWGKIVKFEIVEHRMPGLVNKKVKQVGIFATDAEGIAGAGKRSQEIMQMLTGWEEVPTCLINSSFVGVKPEEVMEKLQGFHNEYMMQKSRM